MKWNLIQSPEDPKSHPEVSVIIPAYNAENWLDDCLSSVASQYFPAHLLEISIYNDLSTDNTWDLLLKWEKRFKKRNVRIVLASNDGRGSRGCGWAKNQAVKNSTGKYLCFLDSDDIMKDNRIMSQFEFTKSLPKPTIVGSNFDRVPADATQRFVEWHRSLTSQNDLTLQQFREVTIIHPTWFMPREVWDSVGGYDERYPNVPEDMIFFYKWLRSGGEIHKVNEILLTYRWHPAATSFAIHRNVLLQEKILHIEQMVLNECDSFTIWGNGRDGKKFFMSLSPASKDKVKAFCDVDKKKIGQIYMDHRTKRKIPIIHFSNAEPLVIVCVATNRSLGGGKVAEFEENLNSMHWREGVDYWHVV